MQALQWRSDGSCLLPVSCMEEQQRMLLHGADLALMQGGGCNDLVVLKQQPSSPAALRVAPRGRAAPPLVCQVPGCGTSLANLKEYYQRYKICEVHRQMDQMVGRDGELQRFCQQCGRFHLLSAFDDNKRSCRERLARHNERRRRRTAGEPSCASGGNTSSKGASGAEVDATMLQEDCWSRGNRSGGMADMPTAAFQPALSIWDQRQLQFQQALLAEQLGQPAMVDLQPLRMEMTSLPSAFDRMHSDFSGDISNTYAMSTADHKMALGPMASRLGPQMLVTGMSDANLVPRISSRPSTTSDAMAVDTRKTFSWPLTHLRIDESHHEHAGLITGGAGALAMHHTYTGDGLMAMRSAGGAMPELQPVAALDCASGDIRVLGENQTLDSIWENIMLIDDEHDNIEC